MEELKPGSLHYYVTEERRDLIVKLKHSEWRRLN